MSGIEGMDKLLEKFGLDSPLANDQEKDPTVPFSVGKGVAVEEWHVIEPRKLRTHYQFRGTIVSYKNKKYELGNPSNNHCLADEVGKPRGRWRMNIPVTYDGMVAAYLAAKD